MNACFGSPSSAQYLYLEPRGAGILNGTLQSRSVVRLIHVQNILPYSPTFPSFLVLSFSFIHPFPEPVRDFQNILRTFPTYS